MNNKKILLIIVVNIILILSIYFGVMCWIKKTPRYDLEIGLFEPSYTNREINIDGYETEKKPDDFVKIEETNEAYSSFCEGKKFITGEEYKKNPIVVLGCSYAYGHGLEEEKTFSYILSKLTKRPVYNASGCASDAIESFKYLTDLIKHNEEQTDAVKKADYYVYIYMYNHIDRHLSLENLMRLYNKINKPSLKDRLTEKLFVLHFLNMKLKKKEILDNFPESEKSVSYQNKMFLYWYKNIKKYSPNAKVIIIIYDEKIPFEHGNYRIKYGSDVMNSPRWKELEEESHGGIKVVHTKDLTGFVFDKDWKLKADINDWHPNERVWEYFTPLFVKEYIK